MGDINGRRGLGRLLLGCQQQLFALPLFVRLSLAVFGEDHLIENPSLRRREATVRHQRQRHLI